MTGYMMRKIALLGTLLGLGLMLVPSLAEAQVGPRYYHHHFHHWHHHHHHGY